MSLLLQFQLMELKTSNHKQQQKSQPVKVSQWERPLWKKATEKKTAGKHWPQQQAGEQSHPSGTARAQEQISLGLNIVKKGKT